LQVCQSEPRFQPGVSAQRLNGQKRTPSRKACDRGPISRLKKCGDGTKYRWLGRVQKRSAAERDSHNDNAPPFHRLRKSG
jgi:hypothetical protein